MSAPTIAEVIEGHLSTGVGCHCGWRISTAQRPVDPRRQHRAHVADAIRAEALPALLAEALREAADEWDRTANPNIGTLAGRHLRARADRIARGVA